MDLFDNLDRNPYSREVTARRNQLTREVEPHWPSCSFVMGALVIVGVVTVTAAAAGTIAYIARLWGAPW